MQLLMKIIYIKYFILNMAEIKYNKYDIIPEREYFSNHSFELLQHYIK